MKKIPEDVMWVIAIKSMPGTFYCGIEMYKRIEEIIDKYPEYFPQEHIYKNIPQSVKDSFNAEKYELYKKYNPFFNDIKEGEGIVGYINRKEEETKNEPKKNLLEILQNIFERDSEYKKQLKILHDKYYKSYGYKFTEP